MKFSSKASQESSVRWNRKFKTKRKVNIRGKTVWLDAIKRKCRKQGNGKCRDWCSNSLARVLLHSNYETVATLKLSAEYNRKPAIIERFAQDARQTSFGDAGTRDRPCMMFLQSTMHEVQRKFCNAHSKERIARTPVISNSFLVLVKIHLQKIK